MKFSYLIVAMFFIAAATEFFKANTVKALFYIFSALLNICTIMMKWGREETKMKNTDIEKKYKKEFEEFKKRQQEINNK